MRPRLPLYILSVLGGGTGGSQGTAPPPPPVTLLKATGVGANGTPGIAYACQVGGPFQVVPGASDMQVSGNAFAQSSLLTTCNDYVPLVGHASGTISATVAAPISGVADASLSVNIDLGDASQWNLGIFTPTGVGIDGQIGLFDNTGTFVVGLTQVINPSDSFTLKAVVDDDTITITINGVVQAPYTVVGRPNKTLPNWGLAFFGDDTGSSISQVLVTNAIT